MCYHNIFVFNLIGSLFFFKSDCYNENRDNIIVFYFAIYHIFIFYNIFTIFSKKILSPYFLLHFTHSNSNSFVFVIYQLHLLFFISLISISLIVSLWANNNLVFKSSFSNSDILF